MCVCSLPHSHKVTTLVTRHRKGKTVQQQYSSSGYHRFTPPTYTAAVAAILVTSSTSPRLFLRRRFSCGCPDSCPPTCDSSLGSFSVGASPAAAPTPARHIPTAEWLQILKVWRSTPYHKHSAVDTVVFSGRLPLTMIPCVLFENVARTFTISIELRKETSSEM